MVTNGATPAGSTTYSEPRSELCTASRVASGDQPGTEFDEGHVQDALRGAIRCRDPELELLVGAAVDRAQVRKRCAIGRPGREAVANGLPAVQGHEWRVLGGAISSHDEHIATRGGGASIGAQRSPVGRPCRTGERDPPEGQVQVGAWASPTCRG